MTMRSHENDELVVPHPAVASAPDDHGQGLVPQLPIPRGWTAPDRGYIVLCYDQSP